MEVGIRDLVSAIPGTLSSCEGHSSSAYVTLIANIDPDILGKIMAGLKEGLLSIHLEDIELELQFVSQPAGSPYPSRWVIWLHNYEKLLPRDKRKVASHLSMVITKVMGTTDWR